jgi:hypothetical protein
MKQLLANHAKNLHETLHCHLNELLSHAVDVQLDGQDANTLLHSIKRLLVF